MTWTYPNGLKTEPRLSAYYPNYGYRPPIVAPTGTTSSFHTGVDYVGFTNVTSVGPGKVIYSGYNSTYGNEVRVDHGGWVSRYGHLASRAVSVGATVNGATKVGVMGNTGLSTGVHLHLRFDRNGKPFDPRPYLAELVNSGSGGGGGGFTERMEDMFRTWYLAQTPAGNWGAFWFTYTFGAIPLTTPELEAIKRENALTSGNIQQYTDTVTLSNLVRRAAAWLVEQIDNAVDDEGILAAIAAVDINPEFQIPADLVAQIAAAVDVPTAGEVAQAVRDELIAPDA